MATTDYGSDVSCVFDLEPTGRVVTERTLVAEAVARRLITPRGQLIDDPQYGYDLTQFIADDMRVADIVELQSGAQVECLKDERVLSAEISIEENTLDASRTKKTLTITITLELIDDVIFDLVLAVDATSVEILQVT